MNRFQLCRRWLLVASILLALQGVSWVFLGSLDPLGIYDGMLASALFGTETLPGDAQVAFAYGVALLGATDAAFFVLFAFVVKYPFAKRETWSHVALSFALVTWFLIDSGFSWSIGAVFNIVFVNVPCLILVGLPLVLTIQEFYGTRVNG